MTSAAEKLALQQTGLYDPSQEHDACGVGFVAHIKGAKTHAIVTQALKILENLDHRGAVGADKLMGDGAGILIQLPDALYREEMAKQGVTLPAQGEYGVGMVFLPKEHASRMACEQELERAVKAEGQVLLGWRDVPVNRDMPMSPTVREKEPVLKQIFIGRGADVIVQDALERKLYVIRKTASAAIQNLKLKHSNEYYIPSMSSRTVVYKGLLLADQVGTYYLDLQDERCVSALGLVHQRFSTNTFPEWPLAHPYRYVAHNGEINTVKGNYNWMKAREGVMSSPVLGDDLQKLYPISFAGQSDTATFDNCLELLTMAGYPISQAVMMMIPEPWENHTTMDERRKAFYEYHAAMLEPWDGPASIVFTDGQYIGATLDRNGLRPSRYYLTTDDRVIMASEVGVLPVDPAIVKEKGRLQPGRMFLIDFEEGRLIPDEELKQKFAAKRPYQEWLKSGRISLDDLPKAPEWHGFSPSTLLPRMQAFGYTIETMHFMLVPMIQTQVDPIGSMGNDSAIACLSDQPRLIYDYFKQLFAQVTNPAIDSIREDVIMSLDCYVGPEKNLLSVTPEHCQRLLIQHPILTNEELEAIKHMSDRGWKTKTIDVTFDRARGKAGLVETLDRICREAEQAIDQGFTMIVLSDRRLPTKNHTGWKLKS